MAIARRLALITIAALAVSASTAQAAGTLTVKISGPGSVTGSGISCSRAFGGAQTGTCSESYANVRVCEEGPFKPICFFEPQTASVTAAPGAPGFAFDGWDGACARQGATCSVEMTEDFAAQASFADVQDPNVGLVSPGASVRGAAVALSASASDNAAVSRVDFSLGGVTISDATAPFAATFDTTAMTDGATSAAATAVDSSGRSKVSSVATTVDNTAPSVTLGGTAAGAVLGPGSTQSWTIGTSDKTTGIALVRCSVVAAGAPASFAPCSVGNTGHTVSAKPAGAYTFTVRAADGAGNITDASRSFSVDATPPDTTIGGGIADGGTTSDNTLAWALSANEPATFACRVYPAALTPGDFAPCSAVASHTASGFAPGTYTFEARGTDAVGNVETTPAKRTFTVVAPPPAPVIAAPGAVGTASAGTAAGNLLAATAKGSAPQILVTLAFGFSNSTKQQTRLTSLIVRNVPAGATVTASCPKRCAKKRFVKKTGASRDVSLAGLIKKPLKVNTLITVVVSKPGSTSAVKLLKIRARKAPVVTTKCRPEGAAKPVAC